MVSRSTDVEVDLHIGKVGSYDVIDFENGVVVSIILWNSGLLDTINEKNSRWCITSPSSSIDDNLPLLASCVPVCTDVSHSRNGRGVGPCTSVIWNTESFFRCLQENDHLAFLSMCLIGWAHTASDRSLTDRLKVTVNTSNTTQRTDLYRVVCELGTKVRSSDGQKGTSIDGTYHGWVGSDVTTYSEVKSSGIKKTESTVANHNLIHSRPGTAKHHSQCFGGIISANHIHLLEVWWVWDICGIDGEISTIKCIWEVTLQSNVDFGLQSWICRFWNKQNTCLGVWHCSHGQTIGYCLIIYNYSESIWLTSRRINVKGISQAD